MPESGGNGTDENEPDAFTKVFGVSEAELTRNGVDVGEYVRKHATKAVRNEKNMAFIWAKAPQSDRARHTSQIWGLRCYKFMFASFGVLILSTFIAISPIRERALVVERDWTWVCRIFTIQVLHISPPVPPTKAFRKLTERCPLEARVSPWCRRVAPSRRTGALNLDRRDNQVGRLRITKPDDHAPSFYAGVWAGGRCSSRPRLGGFFVNEVLKITKGEPGGLAGSLGHAACSLVEPLTGV